MKYLKIIKDILIIVCLFAWLLSMIIPKNKYDLNNDGNIDIKDMLVIQKYILDNSKESDK